MKTFKVINKQKPDEISTVEKLCGKMFTVRCNGVEIFDGSLSQIDSGEYKLFSRGSLNRLNDTVFYEEDRVIHMLCQIGADLNNVTIELEEK